MTSVVLWTNIFYACNSENIEVLRSALNGASKANSGILSSAAVIIEAKGNFSWNILRMCKIDHNCHLVDKNLVFQCISREFLVYFFSLSLSLLIH